MMCGGLLGGAQLSLAGDGSRSATAASASTQPWLINSDTDTTPERTKLETWLAPQKTAPRAPPARRQPRHRGEGEDGAAGCRAQPQPERIEPPDHKDEGNRGKCGDDERGAQVGKDGEQERDGVGVDDEHVEEA